MTTKQALAFLCTELLLLTGPSFPQLSASNPPAGSTQKQLSPDQLDSPVAPIGLYADPILRQVLVTTIYPLETLEAARWLSTDLTLQGKALIDAAAQSWNASVQSGVIFPDRPKRENQDIGSVIRSRNFLAQRNDVLKAVRTYAAECGNQRSAAIDKLTNHHEDDTG